MQRITFSVSVCFISQEEHVQKSLKFSVRVTVYVVVSWSSFYDIAICNVLPLLPTRRNASAGIRRHRVSVCLCLSVTRQYCIKTDKHRIMPHDSVGTSFLTPMVVGVRLPIPPEI